MIRPDFLFFWVQPFPCRVVGSVSYSHRVRSEAKAANPHRVRIRKIGNYYMVALDIEVDGDISSRHAHEICVKVEEEVRRSIENVFDIMIHIEPTGFEHKEKVYGVSPEDLPDD